CKQPVEKVTQARRASPGPETVLAGASGQFFNTLVNIAGDRVPAICQLRVDGALVLCHTSSLG
ncbi:MAG: hypothetical protein ACREJC_17320, partial [Tepidisphaeraceae bacterium]